jgi:cytochrome c-type biogenesis protein CcmH
MRLMLHALLLALALTGSAAAVQPGEELADPVLEARARALSREIRCLVCQNQSIEDSEADLAKDLRLILRERIAAGAEDAEVKAYLVQRYGDFILLKPPVKPATWPLWFGPAAILALVLCGGWLYLRRQSALEEAPPLGPAEQARLDRLLVEGEGEERSGP